MTHHTSALRCSHELHSRDLSLPLPLPLSLRQETHNQGFIYANFSITNPGNKMVKQYKPILKEVLNLS